MLQLMSGARTVRIDSGEEEVTEVAGRILARLLWNRQPYSPGIVYPLDTLAQVMSAAPRLERALQRSGLHADARLGHVVNVRVAYQQFDPPRLNYPVQVILPTGDGQPALSSTNLMVIDVARAERLLTAHSSLRSPQVLLIGSVGHPAPQLNRSRRIVPTPWGEPPFEVVLAGAPD